ncbi:MAG TPA: hypothetical protein VLF91_05415 [Candidatus Saccharimonadales bacterium]|nr:hypothetical protein [Candidatus Saccharimonadales bacterium]
MVSPQGLLDLASQMRNHLHPLIRYAGGWAAGEAGLFRPRPKRTRQGYVYPTEDRLAALQDAQQAWRRAEQAFHRAVLEAPDRDMAGNMWGLAFRARQALAYVPSMEIVAHLMGGSELSEPAIEAKLLATELDVLRLGRSLLKRQKGRGVPTYVRKGMGYEVIAGLLLQRHRPLSHIIIPASLRQDNKLHETARGDLLAVALEGDHPRVLVGVTSPRGGVAGAESTYARMIIDSQADLTLGPGRAPYDTLHALVGHEVYNFTQEAAAQRLDEMSAQLMGRLVLKASGVSMP